ncbi:hypothetical protein L2K70_11245 [Nocardioides KLBMP 9356]|uniref:Uncharacterized protein n=1 Tax=Nocardioides potassii TaxID=2911371 RepID=A0ABS9HCV7_9ACTN|nr:hypothetical protein [Nocardioides potassii]MCF6378178.1 hypothetical protein [Nocardioides potassii]
MDARLRDLLALAEQYGPVRVVSESTTAAPTMAEMQVVEAARDAFTDMDRAQNLAPAFLAQVEAALNLAVEVMRRSLR